MSRLNLATKQTITYAIGFISSVILTIVAYAAVVNDTVKDSFAPAVIALTISALAVLQLVIQLLFFMHLGDEPKPRWKLMSFLFAFIILSIVVFGSLWIMFDLNSRMMMSPTDMIKYMDRQTGL
jgi:cytochrome o ubiquinol oxidase operon protein cyoD